MYKQLLSRNFRDNPYLENSAQRFIYSILLYEGFEDVANEILMNKLILSDEHLKQIADEKLIQTNQNPEEIFNLLRKKIDKINQVDLIKRLWNLRK